MATFDFTLRNELTRNLTPSEADANFEQIEDKLNSGELTGVALTLLKGGNAYNMASANSGLTYTISGTPEPFEYAVSLINTTTEPTVTGATKVGDTAWTTGTDMYLLVYNNGNRTEFRFIKLATS